MAEAASVVVKREGCEPHTVLLDTAQLTIGRDPNCGLILQDENRFVSRLHCTLDRIGGSWWVHDNASRNGVFVSGQRVDGRRRLYEGDVIGIADWEMTFHDPASTNIAPPETSASSAGPSRTLEYDLGSMRLVVDGREFDQPLSRRERTLLNYLAERPGQVCTYDELIQALWVVGDENAVHSLVRRLREKIEPEPARPIFVINVPGFGYRLDLSPPTQT